MFLPMARATARALGEVRPADDVPGNITVSTFRPAAALEVLEREELDSLATPRLQQLRERLHSEHIVLRVKWLQALAGLPAFAATLDDTELQDPLLLNMGTAAHVDPVQALESAVLEAIQSRATIIAGGREDIPSVERDAAAYVRARELYGRWYQTHAVRAWEPRSSEYAGLSPAQAYQAISERIARQGFTTVCVPLSPADSPVAVVKVVVAGCSEVEIHGTVRLGRRLRRAAA